jgi:hypothetical protein
VVTTSIIFSSVQVPPPVPHWLRTMGQAFFPYVTYISYWVILKYAFLGIGQILEAGFKWYLPLW